MQLRVRLLIKFNMLEMYIDLYLSLTNKHFLCRTGDRGQEPETALTSVNLMIGGGVMRAVDSRLKKWSLVRISQVR